MSRVRFPSRSTKRFEPRSSAASKQRALRDMLDTFDREDGALEPEDEAEIERYMRVLQG